MTFTWFRGAERSPLPLLPRNPYRDLSRSMLAKGDAGRLSLIGGIVLRCLAVSVADWTSGAPRLLHLMQQSEADFSIANVAGVSGNEVALQIAIPADVALSDRSHIFLMFRGLPAEIDLTAGFRTRHTWAVSLRDVHRLALVSPPGYQGTFPLEVIFYRGVGISPITRRITVEIRPDGEQSAKAKAFSLGTARETPNQSQPVPSQLANTGAIPGEVPRLFSPTKSISAAEESAMLANARGLVDNGNIASARLLFQDLASKGSGVGAFALAQTFDPNFLQTIVVAGPQQANLEEAKRWYRLAAGLGNRNAQERLQALESRP